MEEAEPDNGDEKRYVYRNDYERLLLFEIHIVIGKGGMENMRTVISHFYNEEYLLPWWLKHHASLFDHGVLINRGSTDRSVEICRQLVPHWEVRDSKVPTFDAEQVDIEVMEIEEECMGWKMALNTTEFLCFPDKNKFFSSLDEMGSSMYSLRTIMLIDDPNYGYDEPDPAKPLVEQRHHGFILPDTGRFIHKYPRGNYAPGRHFSSHPFIDYPFNDNPYPAIVIKFFYSPWTEETRLRKLQIGPTLSEGSIYRSMGLQHLVTREELERRYNSYVNQATDLSHHPDYQRVWR